MRARINIRAVAVSFLLVFASVPRVFALSCPAAGCDDIGTLQASDVYTHAKQVTGPSFSDIYNFSLGASVSGAGLGVTNFSALGSYFDINNLKLSVYGSFDGTGSLLADGGTAYQLPLGQGDYSALVTGNPVGTQGGIYTVVVNAVPLPAPLILFLSGLAGVALIGRRPRTSLVSD